MSTLISGVASGIGSAIQNSATILDNIANDNGAKKNFAGAVFSVIDATNLCIAAPVAQAASKFLKGVAEVAGAFESIDTLTKVVTLRAATDSTIVIDGERYPNPITFAATTCTLISQTGGTVKFLSTMGYLDLGTFGASLGKIPYFGWALEGGIKELPIVRTTFGVIGIILNLCEQFRQVSESGLDAKITLRIATFVGKLIFLVFVDSQIAAIKFLAFVANATACTASLVGVVYK